MIVEIVILESGNLSRLLFFYIVSFLKIVNFRMGAREEE